MNIEEIKKEILMNTSYSIHSPFKEENYKIDVNKVFEILDKYNNQPDYKSAWEELKYEYISGENKQYENNTVKQIQQKYNLGGE